MDEFRLFRISECNVLLGETQGTRYDWLDNSDGSVATFTTFDWWDGKNICNLFVSPQYRRMGYACKLLDFATEILGCTCLAVEKCNFVAKHIYDKYGFKTEQQDDSLYYMRLAKRRNDDG